MLGLDFWNWNVTHALTIVIIRCVCLACQPTSQQYCSFILNQHQPPATSQSAVMFSHNKSAPVISHSQTNTAMVNKRKVLISTTWLIQLESVLSLSLYQVECILIMNVEQFSIELICFRQQMHAMVDVNSDTKD